LDPSVVCTNFTDNGQNPRLLVRTASSTSTNNYINFCALTLPQTPLTNGAQITTGSCNPVPIGLIPSVQNMPSAKFTFPQNFATIPALTAFTISMKLNNMQAGVFTNAQKTYFAAPQTLNAQGQIIGHAHFVVENLTSIDQITPNDPKKFVFFKGINDAGVNGVLSTPSPLVCLSVSTASAPSTRRRTTSLRSSPSRSTDPSTTAATSPLLTAGPTVPPLPAPTPPPPPPAPPTRPPPPVPPTRPPPPVPPTRPPSLVPVPPTRPPSCRAPSRAHRHRHPPRSRRRRRSPPGRPPRARAATRAPPRPQPSPRRAQPPPPL
ncbi:hypothetical protein B0H10DRAFT_2263313, partial [Mycena sp. CBHHK59/15]